MNIELEQGTLEELEGILKSNNHIGFVHSLDMLARQLSGVVMDDSFVFFYENEDRVDYVYPFGPKAVDFIINDIMSRKPRYVSIDGVQEEHVIKLHEFGFHHGDKIYKLMMHNLIDFDPELKGSDYQKLRWNMRVANKAGLQFVESKESDNPELVELLNSWTCFMFSRDKKLEDIGWIRGNIEYSSKIDNYQVFHVRAQDGEILAAAGVGYCAGEAFIEFRINKPNKLRASEYLDYSIMKTLKERGIRQLERGPYYSEGLFNYKKKFPPLEVSKTFWNLEKYRLFPKVAVSNIDGKTTSEKLFI